MRISLLKYISLKKLFNLFKIYLGYYYSIILKKAIVIGYPFSLTVEPTNKCNLHCLECPSGNNSSSRTEGLIDFEFYKKIIDEVKDYILYHMIYFQGEPFLHPNLFKLIEYSDQNKIFTCTSTNGHFLHTENCVKIVQSGLKKIIISMDGTTQETYEKYRVGGGLEKVIEGIKNLINTKKQLNASFPKVYVQFIVFKHNQHQLKEIKKITKSLGVDKLEYKSAQIENFKEHSNLLPTLKSFARYNVNRKSYSIKNKLPNKCFRIWSSLVISWDGTIAPCCFDKDLHYPVGRYPLNRTLDIWKSEEFNAFRKKILSSRKKVPICGNCTEGLRISH